MFRSRGNGRGKRRGGYGTVSKVPLKGLFSDGMWQCNCDPRLPAQHFQTKNGGKNHGRWFYTYQKAQPKRCDFFLWDDEAKGRQAAALLINSRTEPLSSPPTPQKPSPYGITTPQTSTRFRPASSGVTTLYTPSKPSKPSQNALPFSNRENETQATTTQGSDSDEEFYDWPASENDELLKAADQASSGHSMPPPETPRKVAKTDIFSTPAKRRYDEMDSENHALVNTPWPTPSTGLKGDDVFTTPATGDPGKGLFANAALPSPAETPTPIRYKDIPPTQDSELAIELLNALQTQVVLPPAAVNVVKTICNKHVLYTRGIMKGRDVSRAMVKTKDERLAELQGEIEGLRAERESNRAVIRHLRRDTAATKEAES